VSDVPLARPIKHDDPAWPRQYAAGVLAKLD